MEYHTGSVFQKYSIYIFHALFTVLVACISENGLYYFEIALTEITLNAFFVVVVGTAAATCLLFSHKHIVELNTGNGNNYKKILTSACAVAAASPATVNTANSTPITILMAVFTTTATLTTTTTSTYYYYYRYNYEQG